jgi:Brp/Blh family beta-carotene 15,15'-monooxygenase
MVQINIAQLPARAAFSLTAVVAMAFYHLWMRDSVEVQLTIFCALLALTGLPHGAIDPAIARKAGLWSGLTGLIMFSAGYLGLAVIAVGIWFVMPELFIIPMLALSAWHFSGDWSPYFSHPASVAVSCAVITLPALFYSQEVLAIFYLLAPTYSDTIVSGMAVFSILSTLFVFFSCFKIPHPSHTVLAELAILFCAAVALPPIPFFTVYFCLLHSPLHLSESLAQLGLSETVVFAVPFTALSFAAGSLFLLGLPDISFSFQLIQVIFVGLFALTIPHMLLIGALNQGKNR